MEKDAHLYHSILKSWEICSKNSLPVDIRKPLLSLKNEELKRFSEKKRINIGF